MEKLIILTHTVYILAIATNIPVLLMTAFVLQGHIYSTVQKSHRHVGFKPLIYIFCCNVSVGNASLHL